MTDRMKEQGLVIDPRKMSVKDFEKQLAKKKDLTIDELKVMLAREGESVKARRGVEKAIDERLVALASEAMEAVAEEVVDEAREVAAPEAEVEARTDEAGDPITQGVVTMPEMEPTALGDSDAGPVAEDEVSVEPEPEGAENSEQSDDEEGPSLADMIGEMTAKELAGRFGLCRMMGPDPDDPMAPDPAYAEAEPKPDDAPAEITEIDTEDIPNPDEFMDDDGPIVPGDEVHATLPDGKVHEGYFVEMCMGAKLRMRDGQDTIIYAPDGTWYKSPDDPPVG